MPPGFLLTMHLLSSASAVALVPSILATVHETMNDSCAPLDERQFFVGAPFVTFVVEYALVGVLCLALIAASVWASRECFSHFVKKILL